MSDILNSTADITRSREMYKLLAENINDVIWVYNVSIDKLTYISPSVLRLRGFTVEEALNEELIGSLSPESAKIVSKLLPERLAEFLKDPSRHQYYTNELQQKCKNGGLVWIEVTTQFQQNANGEIEILGVSRKIQKRKENELKLSELSLELQQLIKDKDRFISILAHDLRNPFNSLLGLSNLLVSERNQMDEEEVENCIKTINQVSLQTYNLLEDLLMWYRSQAGRLPFEPKVFYVGDVCREVMDNLKIIASAKSITIECNKPEKAALFADVNMFKTVVRNLVTNSIKFTPEKGKIGIDFSVDKEFATISISDNGIGMDENQLAKIWDFSNNAGLGLVLCKEFTQKNGGTIRAESELGKGSRFSFTVPVPAI